MDAQNDRPEFSREPTINDLAALCRHLNEAGTKYVVIGGFAIIFNGYVRTTGDVDLLVDSSVENVSLIKKALLYLPDQAIREIAPEEVAQYTVVRIADEIVIDLMHKACEVTYDKAKDYVQYLEVDGVQIPYLKPEMLIQTKLGMRAKDVQDRKFLEYLLAHQHEKKFVTNSKGEKKNNGIFRRFFQTIRRLFHRPEKE